MFPKILDTKNTKKICYSKFLIQNSAKDIMIDFNISVAVKRCRDINGKRILWNTE